MRGIDGFSWKTKYVSQSLTPWLSLFLAPIAFMLLLLSQVGSVWLDRGAARPAAAAILPGLTVEPAPAMHRHELVITSIRSDSPAIDHGIAVGDTIVEIDDKPIFSLDQARRSLQKDKTGTVTLKVVHGTEFRDIRLVRTSQDRKGERHGAQAADRRG